MTGTVDVASAERPAPGLRARKKALVREALVAAAHDLFAARGFDGVTIDEIARAAAVSRRSFFRYFPTKEDIVLVRRREQLASFAARLAEQRGYAGVRAACLALAEQYIARRSQILAERALVAAAPSLVARDLEFDRAFERVITRALGRGRRARMCAAAVTGVIRVALDEWAAARELDLRALGREALALVAPLLPGARAK